MSKFGFILCILYVAASGLCVWAGIASSQDPKGSFVLLQLPLALQAGLLHWLGADGFLDHLSWPAAYAAIGLPTAAALYGFGAILSSMAKTVASGQQRPAP